MALIAKAVAMGNFDDPVIGIAKVRSDASDPQPTQELVRRHLDVLLKSSFEGANRQV